MPDDDIEDIHDDYDMEPEGDSAESAGIGYEESPDFEQPPMFEGELPPEDQIEIDDVGSQIASTPAKNVMLLVVMVIGAIIFLYFYVFKEDDATKKERELQEVLDSQPVDAAIEATQDDEKPNIDIGVIDEPSLPDIEVLQPLPAPTAIEVPDIEVPDDFGGFEPPPIENEVQPEPSRPVAQPVLPPAPIPQDITPVENLTVNDDTPDEPSLPQDPATIGPTPEQLAAQRAALLASRRKSSMLVMNGGGNPSSGSSNILSEDGTPKTVTSRDQLSHTSASQVAATKIGNTDYMIAQGKMIEAILETAVNTDLPGSLRAIISRDIYAESGKSVLIPKGSRLIGEYNNQTTTGQRRILVSWSRLIRPDGIDVAIGSPGTDQLGRAGVRGITDNKYFEIFSNALLLSAITVGGAIVFDQAEGSDSITTSTTTGSDGGTTGSRTGNTSDLAVLDAVEDLSDVAQDIAADFINTQPTIIVRQGARIRVYVNKDLVFPEESVNKVKFVN